MTTACLHHWVCPPPNGIEAVSTCKNCGEVRTFYNESDKVLIETYAKSRRAQSEMSKRGHATRKALNLGKGAAGTKRPAYVMGRSSYD